MESRKAVLWLHHVQHDVFCNADRRLSVDAGVPIRYCFDGKLLNLRKLQAKSKVQTDVVLLYADDLAENAKSEENCKGL